MCWLGWVLKIKLIVMLLCETILKTLAAFFIFAFALDLRWAMKWNSITFSKHRIRSLSWWFLMKSLNFGFYDKELFNLLMKPASVFSISIRQTNCSQDVVDLVFFPGFFRSGKPLFYGYLMIGIIWKIVRFKCVWSFGFKSMIQVMVRYIGSTGWGVIGNQGIVL